MIKHNHFTDLLPYQKQQLRVCHFELVDGAFSTKRRVRAFPPPSAGGGQESARSATTLRTPRPDSRGPAPPLPPVLSH